MLGRKKDSGSTAVAEAPVVAPKPGGKGRATPKRSQAQARNRRGIVSAPGDAAARKAASKEERQARREVARAQRMQVRQALLTGDERHLPLRDKGPVRRWVRDYVDARRNPGELFLPIALAVVLITVYPNAVVQLAGMAVLYTMVIVSVVDAVLLRRRLKRETEARFGVEKAAGAATYGMMRSFQIRRTRLPKPMVGRGEFPR